MVKMSHTNTIGGVRAEVMKTLEQSIDKLITKYLKPVETNWQPSDILPDTKDLNFIEKVREIQELARELSYDLFVVLIGDTITEEALPTYESWLMSVEGICQHEKNSWARWIRGWTAEENRHGDLLHTYLYLSGRVNMREMQVTTQYLINDGIDIGTDSDPYRNFIYTSFQELATNISHRRVGTLARKAGNQLVEKICNIIALDEARHATAYIQFVKKIFEIDRNEMMLALEDMMKKNIVMPAHFLRESGQKMGELFSHFSDTAQRAMVYTTEDYVNIMKSLLKQWDLEHMVGLSAQAEKARDYLMKLPDRLTRISQRLRIPKSQYKFKWVSD